jgi:uncharacterized protein YkwD
MNGRALISICLISLVLAVAAGCVSGVPQAAEGPAAASPTITPYVPPATQGPAATEAPTEEVQEPPTSTPVAVSDDPPPPDVADWPGELARLINEVRAQQGLPSLTYDETLALAAQRHANDCSQHDSCSSTGSDLETRLLQVGYQAVAADQSWAMSPSPQEAMDWWLAQEAPDDWPRQMMLSGVYTEAGVGVAPASWGYYFVVVFGQP